MSEMHGTEKPWVSPTIGSPQLGGVCTSTLAGSTPAGVAQGQPDLDYDFNSTLGGSVLASKHESRDLASTNIRENTLESLEIHDGYKQSDQQQQKHGSVKQIKEAMEERPSHIQRSIDRENVAAAAAASAGAAATNNANTGGGIRPWLLILIISVVQMLLSSMLPSNGVVNASSDQVGDPRGGRGGTEGNGNRGNSHQNGAEGKGRDYNRQYFRQWPPISDIKTAAGTIVTERMTESRRLQLREEAKKMFMHGYQGYLDYAFPMDELNPVACSGRGPDRANPDNININDVLGDFSLTLIDSLDTLAVMREFELFQEAIEKIKKYVRDFDRDSRVQVFEVNIRVLGALLSGHLYATDPKLSAHQSQSQYQNVKRKKYQYQGELLRMAEDLGKRLIKAFENTPTGLPWPRVNLKRGVLREESIENCVAGAGSLLLEFGVLSRLTGDKSYEEAAKKALHELWKRRSKIGLMGNTINISTGQWMSSMTGIGAGTDSFHEYLIKSYVLFGDEEYFVMYESAQEAIRRTLLHDSKYFYKHVNMEDGTLMAHWVDSLSAFMPGVQVLGGDLESAIKNHLYYYNIWRKYQAIPERFDFVQQTVAIANYPLRPEFIESTYFLYRATKDPFYLEVGEMILRDLQAYTKTKCGWASLRSVVDKKHEDRMESFALSETIKYLFLLFDEENILHHELKDSNFVFTTEGHILYLDIKYLSPNSKDRVVESQMSTSKPNFISKAAQSVVAAIYGEHAHSRLVKTTPTAAASVATAAPVCKAYCAPETFLKSIVYRPDADFARQMVGAREDIRDILETDPKGYCEVPTLDVERVIVEFIGPPKKTIFDLNDNYEENTDDHTKEPPIKAALSSDELKDPMVIPIKKGVFVNRVVGVKMHIQYDSAQNGYRAVKVEDYPLSSSCSVYVEQSSMKPLWDSYQRAQAAHLRLFKVQPSSVDGMVIVKDLSIMPAQFGTWRPRLLDYNQAATYNTYETTLKDYQVEEEISFQPRWDREQEDTYQRQQQQQQPLSVPLHGSATSARMTSKRRFPTKRFARIEDNTNGCQPYTTAQSNLVKNKIVAVDRGGCLFILKAYYAQAAGAHSMIVINTDDNAFVMTGANANKSSSSSSSSAPTSESNESSEPQKSHDQEINDDLLLGDNIHDDEIDIHVVMVGHSQGQQLLEWIQEESLNDPSMSSDTNVIDMDAAQEQEQRQPALVSTVVMAGIVQRKVSKEEMANARLSYDGLPIVNIIPVSIPNGHL
ncbi:alpha mannosidase-like protein [Lobosporangium transversale]|uniref:alpha-1,2-Mannosidase n=1 Tax=Lobosporangium transversale TaxID=64571 RepID=A0A1Y2GTV2_9FUNG|nr:glycoside hydrolase [Lobosporangium transversale]KAF9914216.1 alpha mannosidase-like protein [Lobosporangium transversale]ORZ22916.1 glycoside hydrolase [Lobosporangium transversale]|eukprot:XP_021883470.1 glycoside hydrolase [Lobosporangium transversale]